MNLDVRFASQWIVAQQGKGKTTLLLSMLANDLQKDYSVVVMDSKGELTGAIRSLALGDRLIVFDPDEPFAINPFDVAADQDVVSHLAYMLSALLDTNITAKQRTFFESLVYALLLFPRPNIMLLWDLVSKGPQSHADFIRTLSEDTQSFFFNEWKGYSDTAGEMQWRLRGLLNKSVFKTMFNVTKTRFNIGKAMDEGKVIVIDNSQAKCTQEGCGFLGRFFVSQIWSAGTARALIPDHLKRPTFVYIDEANLVIKKDQKIAAIIDELRGQKIGLILAHQKVRGHIDDLNVLSSLENCAIKMVNVGAEADYFSKLMLIPEERMNRLPRGHFAMDVPEQPPSIVQVEPIRPNYRQMAPSEQQQLKQRMKDLYGVQPVPTTHKAPQQSEASRVPPEIPAEADKPIIPPQTPTGKKPYW